MSEAPRPTSLTVEDLARLLSAAGAGRVVPEDIEADLQAGAPVGEDGRVNLVHYAAWLIGEERRGR